MELNPSLYPFRSITHGGELLGGFDLSAVEFAQRQVLKQLRLCHTREVGMRLRRDDRFSIDHLGLAHFADNQGFGFRPFAMQQWHKGAIQAQY